MSGTVLIIGTLDTKAGELAYLRQRIEAEGARTILMDVSCKSMHAGVPSDISCHEVAAETGRDFSEVALLDKVTAPGVMTLGALRTAEKLMAEDRFQGIIGLGGANGAEMTCAVMRELPIGFPKLMVTCVASGNVRPYVGTKDIIMVNSIGDISLNRITRRIISNASRAIAHMALAGPLEEEDLKPQVCISTFGTTLPCVEKAKGLLEEKGFEVIELHASGSGGMALEELVRSGEVTGVLDITTSEIVDDLVGGMYSAGPHRLEAAAETGTPQVISLGALDFGNFGGRETIPPAYRDRHFFFYTPSITLMRTTREESEVLGRRIADKANASRGPAAVIVPWKGFSLLDRAGGKKRTRIDGTDAGPWYDEAADGALINAIKKHLDPSRVELVEMDAHINDPEFAEAAVQLLIRMIRTPYT
ncbi:MAG: Tm-1-like ATP-binding domain-containing protein [Pseudomonadota bacterium]